MSEPPSNPGAALTARIAPSFALRAGLIAVMCLVFGIWGIYDYVHTYPQMEALFARGQVARAFLTAAEPLQDSGERARADTWNAYNKALLTDLETELPAHMAIDLKATQEAVTALDPTASASINALLNKQIVPTVADAPDRAGRFGFGHWIPYVHAMTSTAAMGRGVAEDVWTKQLQQGILAARQSLDMYGEVEEPAAYDRPMQWVFILCLPFAPWYAWTLIKHGRRRYRLDEDGTLHLPEGTWAAEDIADIDMGTWMKSSKAWVVHTDGTRVMLDDYIYKPLWRIVGELAASRYPEAWTEEAKPVKPKADENADEDDDA